MSGASATAERASQVQAAIDNAIDRLDKSEVFRRWAQHPDAEVADMRRISAGMPFDDMLEAVQGKVGEFLLTALEREVVELRREIASLKSAAIRATLADSFTGLWSASTEYHRGDLAISGGSTWLAISDTKGSKPGESPAWKLFAQGGRDGRDRRF